MHRGTAPNHIHIFIRLINSDSGTFSRHGTFTPSLDTVSANGRPMYTQIGSNACIFNTEWFQILQPRFSLTSIQLLKRDITGLSGKFSLTSSSNLSDGLTLRWADIFYNHNTLLCIDWQNFLLVQIETRGYQIIKLPHGVYTYFISNPYIVQFWWICLPAKASAWHFKDTLRSGTQNFLISFFTSLSCLNINILYMSLDFIILTFTADTAKKLPPEEEATERFRICIVT